MLSLILFLSLIFLGVGVIILIGRRRELKDYYIEQSDAMKKGFLELIKEQLERLITDDDDKVEVEVLRDNIRCFSIRAQIYKDSPLICDYTLRYNKGIKLVVYGEDKKPICKKFFKASKRGDINMEEIFDWILDNLVKIYLNDADEINQNAQELNRQLIMESIRMMVSMSSNDFYEKITVVQQYFARRINSLSDEEMISMAVILEGILQQLKRDGHIKQDNSESTTL